MPKCHNYVCLNDVIVGFKPETYCRSCLHSDQPYVFMCDVCETLFTVDDRLNAHLQRSCSPKCKRIKRSIKCKIRYMKAHPPKEKECPSCKKKFTKNTKYCSYGCHGHRQAHVRRVKSYFKKKIPAMNVYLKYGGVN